MTYGSFLQQYIFEKEFLDFYGTVIMDEFHERGAESDTLFAVLEEKLKIIVMSATIDTLIFDNSFKTFVFQHVINVNINICTEFYFF
jgi:HrpA-like RNA helicase